MTVPVLDVQGLGVRYGRNTVVRDVDLQLWPGTITGLVGESGCGKSTTALASLGYVPPGGTIVSGVSRLKGDDLLHLDVTRLRSIWGGDVAYVSQGAGSALNPALRVGRQLEDSLRTHTDLAGPERTQRKMELLSAVGLPHPDEALHQYPHQFSGGQQQRIALAIAIACRPSVLVLDEPTTGLDVTTQSMVSGLLRQLIAGLDIAALYVSHDIALLSNLASRLIVMYAGEVAESGSMQALITAPAHPYTQALLAAVPRVDELMPVVGIRGEPPTSVVSEECSFVPRCPHAQDVCREKPPPLRAISDGHEVRCVRLEELGPWTRDPAESPNHGYAFDARDRGPILEVEGLTCAYRQRGHTQVAVEDVSCVVRQGETLGIVGESGSGKSTLLRAIVGLHPPEAGTVRFEGKPLDGRVRKRLRDTRRRIQLIFQDPGSSLNPRETVRQALLRPIRFLEDNPNGVSEREIVESLLADVRLPRGLANRYPWELSGGQQQRVALARALASRPSLLLCDEVTSALDVSVQASVLELLGDITSARGIGVIFVSHDLAVIRSLADRVLVMKNGSIRESGSVQQIFHEPKHAYTVELMDAIPKVMGST